MEQLLHTIVEHTLIYVLIVLAYMAVLLILIAYFQREE